MKDRILNLIVDIFKESDFPEQIPDRCNAQEVADILSVKRNTASRHLNDLVISKELVKINSRPVLFLPRRIAENRIEHSLDLDSYLSIDDILSKTNIGRRLEEEAFNGLIGYDKSLYGTIEQLISAMKYPGGLPVLLFGNSGVGKSVLAEKIYQYCKKFQIINKDAPFVEFNCAQYYNNPELLTSQLFGHTRGSFTGADADHKGIIENADGGIVFLDEIHRLTPEGQEKLFLHMDKGVFRRIGDNGPWRKSNVRYIFATTETKSSVFLSTFIRRIPIICTIPNYADRALEERKELAFCLFEKEAKIIQNKILVSEAALNFLLKFDPEGNIGEIEGLIKQTVAKKYARKKNKEYIEVKVLDFPERYLEKHGHVKQSNISGRRTYVFSPENYIQSENNQKSLQEKRNTFFEKVLFIYEEYGKGNISLQTFNNLVSGYVSGFCDSYMLSKDSELMAKFFVPELHNIFQSIESNIFFSVKGSTIQIIASYLFQRGHWEDENTVDYTKLGNLKNFIINEYITEFNMIFSILENTLDIQLSLWDRIYIGLCLAEETNITKRHINVIILAHGHATASSIANVANRLVNQHIIDSIDMPMNIQVSEVIKRLRTYINSYQPKKGLLILVDMGSLAQLSSDIEDLITCPTAIINNVSTAMALDIASNLVQNCNMEELVERVPKDAKVESHLLFPIDKKNLAILVLCNTGIGTAIKLKDMFEEFLPPGIEINFIPYANENINIDSMIFKTNEVIAIVGTDNPQLLNIPFISLEDLFKGEAGELFNLFKKIFNIDVAKEIDRRIVKNLTLDRLIDSLTILDAPKVVEQIDACIILVEELSGVTLTTSKKISLYVHLSCMIERLIRNRAISSFPDLQIFVLKHHDKVKIVQKSLEILETLYTIKIPLEEISYVVNILNAH